MLTNINNNKNNVDECNNALKRRTDDHPKCENCCGACKYRKLCITHISTLCSIDYTSILPNKSIRPRKDIISYPSFDITLPHYAYGDFVIFPPTILATSCAKSLLSNPITVLKSI